MTSFTKYFSSIIIAITLCVAAIQSATASDKKTATIEISHPYAKAPLNNARVTGGYLTIKNIGPKDDKLIGVKVDFAQKAEIHEMKMDNDVMKMREIKGGLLIPAGQSSILVSGGKHIMFMGLNETLKDGDKRKAILVFENAGEIEISFSFESLMKIKMRAKSNSVEMKTMDNNMDKMKHN